MDVETAHPPPARRLRLPSARIGVLINALVGMALGLAIFVVSWLMLAGVVAEVLCGMPNASEPCATHAKRIAVLASNAGLFAFLCVSSILGCIAALRRQRRFALAYGIVHIINIFDSVAIGIATIVLHSTGHANRASKSTKVVVGLTVAYIVVWIWEAIACITAFRFIRILSTAQRAETSSDCLIELKPHDDDSLATPDVRGRYITLARIKRALGFKETSVQPGEPYRVAGSKIAPRIIVSPASGRWSSLVTPGAELTFARTSADEPRVLSRSHSRTPALPSPTLMPPRMPAAHMISRRPPVLDISGSYRRILESASAPASPLVRASTPTTPLQVLATRLGMHKRQSTPPLYAWRVPRSPAPTPSSSTLSVPSHVLQPSDMSGDTLVEPRFSVARSSVDTTRPRTPPPLYMLEMQSGSTLKPPQLRVRFPPAELEGVALVKRTIAKFEGWQGRAQSMPKGAREKTVRRAHTVKVQGELIDEIKTLLESAPAGRPQVSRKPSVSKRYALGVLKRPVEAECKDNRRLTV